MILGPRRHRLLFALPGLLLVAAAGCGAPLVSPSVVRTPEATAATAAPPPSQRPAASAEPSVGHVVPGLTWITAADVERPPDMSAAEPSIPAVGPGGGLGHPGHFPGQGYLVDVVDGPAGLVAVGYGFPGWHATAWTTTDSQRWTRHVIDEADDTFALAVASTRDGYVAVGRAGNQAAAWTSPDGATWARSTGGPAVEPGLDSRMTAVAAGDGGLVAAGWAGSPTTPTMARLWWSVDGRSWEAATVDGAGAGPSGAETRVASVSPSSALSVGAPRWVAVGTAGPDWGPTGSVAWTSQDGRSWTRSPDDADLGAGQMASVTVALDGFVAVGSDLDERQGVSWISRDGRDWTASSPQPALDNHGLKIRMTDVIQFDGQFVAVGNYLFGTQYGNATSWTSTDGLTWTQAPRAAPLNQGEMLSVTPGGPGYVAVGTFGAPDDYVPTVWLSPRS